MNTRNKIVAQAHLPSTPAILVIGTFDPLLAGHAVRLARLAQSNLTLVVAVTDETAALLPLNARMELVSALRMVDFVLPYTKGLEHAFPWVAIHDDCALHQQWRSDFQEHVRRRSQSA